MLDQTLACNIENAPEPYRSIAQPVVAADGKVLEWTIPKGTVVEGDEALLRVSTGQASPIDEECAAACGMTTAQLKGAQRAYLAASSGIRGKKDHELFMAEVIDGYAPDSTDDKPVYVPGKNHQKWLDAKAAIAASDKEEI